MIPYKTLIIYDRRKDKTSLRMRVKWCNSTRVVSFNLHIKVDEGKFDLTTMRAKRNTFHYGISASDINSTIQHFEDNIRECFMDYSHRGKNPTTDQLKNALRDVKTVKNRPMTYLLNLSRRKKARNAFRTIRSTNTYVYTN